MKKEKKKKKNALIEDVNKTTSRQAYNVVKSGGNKKDKNGDLRKVRRGCSRRKAYKDERKRPGKAYDKGEDKLQTINGKLTLVGKIETGT